MTVSTRAVLLIGTVVCIVTFVVGLLVGHFAISKSESDNDNENPGAGHLLNTQCQTTTTYTDTANEYKDSYLMKSVENTCHEGTCHTENLPRTYLAYHLNGKQINIDGRLDDEAWEDVPWTDTFMDIRGPSYPAPKFDTKVKVRWDDSRLYVGAWMQQTDMWGDITQDETHVWKQNAFEVYAVPDGSMHKYKEMQINVLNTTWDLMLDTAYMDNICDAKDNVAYSDWDSQLVKATYTDGTINDPANKGTFWSAEWSFSFAALAENTTRTLPSPNNQEAWFFIFARPEYAFNIVNGKYELDETEETQWWSWQPMYTVNLHLPSRFGLVQFKRDMNDKEFLYEKWHIYNALFQVFEAEHKYKSINGNYVTDLTALEVAPKLLSSNCVTITVTLTDNNADFNVAVRSRLDSNLQIGHIRKDRYVWFT